MSKFYLNALSKSYKSLFYNFPVDLFFLRKICPPICTDPINTNFLIKLGYFNEKFIPTAPPIDHPIIINYSFT